MVRYFLHKMYLFIAVTSECVSHSVMWPHGPCSSPGSPIHGVFQARTLESVAISSSRGSPRPRDWIPTFCISGRFCTIWATAVAQGWPFCWTDASLYRPELQQPLWLPHRSCSFLLRTSLLPPAPRLQPVLSPPTPQSPPEAGGGTTLASLPPAQLRGKAPEPRWLSGLLLPFPLSIRAASGSVLPWNLSGASLPLGRCPSLLPLCLTCASSDWLHPSPF